MLSKLVGSWPASPAGMGLKKARAKELWLSTPISWKECALITTGNIGIGTTHPTDRFVVRNIADTVDMLSVGANVDMYSNHCPTQVAPQPLALIVTWRHWPELPPFSGLPVPVALPAILT
jgi:hypothetical protein